MSCHEDCGNSCAMQCRNDQLMIVHLWSAAQYFGLPPLCTGLLRYFARSIPEVVIATVVLLLGLWNMMRGTSPSTSQKLMRWRVGLQFLAIVIVMAFFLITR
jgi:hypothetical protein